MLKNEQFLRKHDFHSSRLIFKLTVMKSGMKKTKKQNANKLYCNQNESSFFDAFQKQFFGKFKKKLHLHHSVI